MAQEKTTVARPYAEAVYDRGAETDKLDLWSDMLALLGSALSEPALADLVTNPLVAPERIQQLMLEIGGGYLNEEGRNFVKVLVENDRLPLLPDIVELYEQLKRERQGVLEVQVSSAYALNQAQKKELIEVLKERLNRDIKIRSEKDPDLIGGIVIRAGDLVIDGSVRGQLHKLANELRI
jgi:F-type H+-transporting ATPase subunit delta